MAITKSVIKGIGFPFRKGSTGFPAVATDDNVVRDSIIRLLGTEKGERVMRPQLGVSIRQLLFEPNTPIMAELIREQVFTAIGTFEPRAILKDVVVTRTETEITILILYVNRLTLRAQNLPIIFSNPIGVPS